MAYSPTREQFSAAELAIIARVKRFLECVEADPGFRRRLRPLDLNAAQQYLAEHGVELPVADLKALYEPEFRAGIAPDEAPGNPLAALWSRYRRQRRAELAANLERFAGGVRPRALAKWRNRQLARLRDEVRDGFFSPVIAYELSLGCSIGCAFCALSAGRLEAVFDYTPDHAQLWRGLLAGAREFLGPAAAAAGGYHATEPADNPGYLDFLGDFHVLNAVLPQTTTAAPLLRPEWTRRLLARRAESPDFVDRFSIRSEEMLAAVHREFTPDELLDVSLVMVNAGALSGLAPAGRARINRLGDKKLFGSAECVCGFVVNLPSRKIRLLAPCQASDRWPQGARIIGETNFAGVDEFAAKLAGLVADHLKPGLPRRLAWREGAEIELASAGFTVASRTRRQSLDGQTWHRLAGELLLGAGTPPADFGQKLIAAGAPAGEALGLAQRLFASGMLKENYET